MSDPGAADSIAALQAEVVLLREENASLKAAPHQAPDLGPALARARGLPAPATDREDVADEAAHLVAEALVLRESLLEVCQELQRSIAAVEARLGALTPSAKETTWGPEGGRAQSHASTASPSVAAAGTPNGGRPRPALVEDGEEGHADAGAG